jgi:predicted transposase/invertase (TIGR01784 family)
MTKVWDDTVKRLVRANPQDFVSWLLERAQFKDLLSVELKNRTIVSDILLLVLIDGEEVLLHIEFQSTDDEDMALRLLEYNVLATREHKRRVYSCVIYLRKDSNLPESPMVWFMPNGSETLRFSFEVMKLREMTAESLLKTNLVGLFPLLPLTKDGKRHEVVEEMVTRLIEVKQPALLRYAQMFSSLVFKDKDDKAWLERRFAMYKDILEESWVYQETKLEGKLDALQQTIIKHVQARFPEMLNVTKKQIDNITDIEVLQNLLLQISLAQNIGDALQALLDATKKP